MQVYTLLYYSNLSYVLYGVIIFIFKNNILKLVKDPKKNDRKIINTLSVSYILIGLISSIVYIDGIYLLIIVLGFPWVLIKYYKS